jgi:hypothetical protein
VVANSVMFRVASALIAVGIVLALANWYTKPDGALAWMAVLVMFSVMAAALTLSRRAIGRWAVKATAMRSSDQITTAVVFAGLIMGIPLALTLARTYGFGDGSDIARRSTGVLTSLFLVMIGNAMPKNLPPLSSGCDGARQQWFHRLAGWTWVLCGLLSAIGWLVLPMDYAEAAAVGLVITAIAATALHLVRLVRLGRRARTSQTL